MKKVMSLLLVVMMITLVGCSGEENKEDTSKAKEEKQIVIGFANLDDAVPFPSAVKTSIIKEAEKIGVKVIAVDNQRDGNKAVENADNLATQQVDVFIEFNVDSQVGPAIMDIMNEANIPVIAVDIPHPGAVFFGANNPVAGKITGEALVKEADARWDGKVDLLILVENPKAGEVPQQRMDGILEAVQGAYSLSEDIIIHADGEGDAIKTQEVITNILTAHPDSKNILIGCLADVNGLGVLAAVQSAGREDEVLIASQNADNQGLGNLREDEATCWIGTTAYTPERYGEYLVPLAMDILAGKEVPAKNHPDHVFVDRSNVDALYPE